MRELVVSWSSQRYDGSLCLSRSHSDLSLVCLFMVAQYDVVSRLFRMGESEYPYHHNTTRTVTVVLSVSLDKRKRIGVMRLIEYEVAIAGFDVAVPGQLGYLKSVPFFFFEFDQGTHFCLQSRSKELILDFSPRSWFCIDHFPL